MTYLLSFLKFYHVKSVITHSGVTLLIFITILRLSGFFIYSIAILLFSMLKSKSRVGYSPEFYPLCTYTHFFNILPCSLINKLNTFYLSNIIEFSRFIGTFWSVVVWVNNMDMKTAQTFKDLVLFWYFGTFLILVTHVELIFLELVVEGLSRYLHEVCEIWEAWSLF